MTTVYCCNCGVPVGKKTGEGAVVGLLCTDPACSFLSLPNLQEDRNAMMVALLDDRVPAPVIATAFSTSRQRVYQIASSWRRGQ